MSALVLRPESRNAPISLDAVTSVRIASFLGLPIGPFALSTAPVPLRKPHARHELHPLELTA